MRTLIVIIAVVAGLLVPAGAANRAGWDSTGSATPLITVIGGWSCIIRNAYRHVR